MPNASDGPERRRGARAPNEATGGTAPAPAVSSVAAFLRALADQVERDAAFGEQVHALLVESGLVGAPGRSGPRRAGGRTRGTGAGADDRPAPLDPFAVLRADGESHLRARLGEVEIADLRRIIRAHRLDPARVSARWSSSDRLVELIVDQVRARADHGKAFARV